MFSSGILLKEKRRTKTIAPTLTMVLRPNPPSFTEDGACMPWSKLSANFRGSPTDILTIW
ncbi:MAG: hypothetical protein J6Q67_06850 [Clostridia bacterium]|nr:hypothetical protein [Clostridia bacterium]